MPKRRVPKFCSHVSYMSVKFIVLISVSNYLLVLLFFFLLNMVSISSYYLQRCQSGDDRANSDARWLRAWLACRFLQVAGSNPDGATFRRVITWSKLFTRICSGQLSLSSFRVH